MIELQLAACCWETTAVFAQPIPRVGKMDAGSCNMILFIFCKGEFMLSFTKKKSKVTMQRFGQEPDCRFARTPASNRLDRAFALL